jgi:hypothetical protein
MIWMLAQILDRVQLPKFCGFGLGSHRTQEVERIYNRWCCNVLQTCDQVSFGHLRCHALLTSNNNISSGYGHLGRDQSLSHTHCFLPSIPETFSICSEFFPQKDCSFLFCHQNQLLRASLIVYLFAFILCSISLVLEASGIESVKNCMLWVSRRHHCHAKKKVQPASWRKPDTQTGNCQTMVKPDFEIWFGHMESHCSLACCAGKGSKPREVIRCRLGLGWKGLGSRAGASRRDLVLSWWSTNV